MLGEAKIFECRGGGSAWLLNHMSTTCAQVAMEIWDANLDNLLF